MNRTDLPTAPTAYYHDCCLDDSCPGHEGWVTCDSFPADARMIADILDAAADFDRMTRHLSRFGTSAIADEELAQFMHNKEHAA